MRDLGQMLKVTAFHASGPDDGEDVEIYRNSGAESDDDFISRDQIDDEFLWVSWLQQECGLIRQLGDKLQASDSLCAERNEDQLLVDLNGEHHVLQLSIDTHNTYIVLSSMAYLLEDSYDFWLVKYLVEDDVHAILVTTKMETRELTSNHSGALSRWFIKLEPGLDHFSGIDVPYLDHEHHNPRFEEQRDAIAPIIARIHEEVACRSAQLLEERRQRGAWLERIRHDLNASEVSVSEIIRTSREYEKNNAQTLKTFAHKIALLRQEIAGIVERP